MTLVFRFSRLAILAWLVVFGLAVRPAGAIEADAARTMVTAIVDEAMATFAGKTMTPEQRSTALSRLIEKYTDVPFVSRAALGADWARATDQEKAAFGPLLLKYVAHTWQGSLSDLSVGQKVIIESAHPKGKYVIIRSKAIIPGEDSAIVDWVFMTMPQGRDIVIDISVDGASILRTLQADFSSFIRRNDGKISALFDEMTKRIAANHK